jgi:PKD repeat protein
MKIFIKILAALVIGLSLTSCNTTPYADVELSSTKVKAGQPIEITNKSLNCDISMIVLGGEGIYNNYIRVGEDFEVTDQNFVFTYAKPGKYTIRVIAENSKSISGTNYASIEKVIEVLPE